MKRQTGIGLAVWILIGGNSLGDFASPSPTAWNTKSSNGRYQFEIDPKQGAKVTTQTKEGKTRLVWKSEGWYAYRGFLSDDGRYFAGLGAGMFPSQDPDRDLAVLFVKDGKLLKKHRVPELIPDGNKLAPTVSHYLWEPKQQGVENGFHSDEFKLITIDKTIHVFDPDTGNRISHSHKDPQAKTHNEVMQELEAKEARKGQKLFHSAKWRTDFEAQFEFSDIRLNEGWIYGIPFEAGEQWSADLSLRNEREIEITIELICQAKNGELIMKYTPEDINQVLDQLLANKQIKQKIKDLGAYRIRLRMLGDRLHWDAEDLQEIGAAPPEQLKEWVQFIIDTIEPGKERYTKVFYLPGKEQVIID